MSKVKGTLHNIATDKESILSVVPGVYLRWVKQDEYVVLFGLFKHGKIKDMKTVRSLASKRGNSAYHRRIRNRLKGMLDLKKSPLEVSKRRNKKFKTNTLFFTLTFDPDIGFFDGWQNGTFYLNRFFSSLREKYGKISYFWSAEAHKSGRLHFHVVVDFKEAGFNAFEYHGKNGLQVRINPKGLFKDIWHYGFVDVKGLDSVQGGIKYISKYLLKSLNGRNSKADYTLSLSWFFNRRLWSVSGDFLDLMKQSITQIHDYIIRNLDGDNLGWEWNFIGIFPRWFIGYSLKGNKPPPKQLIEYSNSKKMKNRGYPVNFHDIIFDLSEKYHLHHPTLSL